MWNWFGNKSKSELPEPTALQTQRSKQIEQLRTFNTNVTEIQRDVEYRVNRFINGHSVNFNITLPPRFPQDKPCVKISPPVRHPWVGDQDVVIGCPGINNFTVHSDLGRVIKDLLQEFQTNPPTMLPAQQQHYGGYPAYPPAPSVAGSGPPAFSAAGPYTAQMPMPPTLTAASTAAYTATGAPIPQLPPGPVGSYRLPDIPISFPALKDLSLAELQELMDNEDQMIERLGALPEVEQISRDRQKLCADNEQQAKDNLAKKPALEERKRMLLEKYDQLNELRQTFDASSWRQDQLREQYNPRALEERLQQAAVSAEEDAEALADKFLEGGLSIEEFKKEYMQTRTLGYLRRAKEEKISQSAAPHAGF